MQISDIESKRLLPSWAHGIDWIQAVFDFIVRTCATRIPALEAPLTRQSIECLTNEELEQWFDRLGVVEYYPELSRETREKMLYWLARLYRFLGTPQAVRILCEYIHDGEPLNVVVHDDLAWEGETLVEPSLLDVFDVEIDAESPQITPALAYRIRNNILRIARNTQQLRNIIYKFSSWIAVPVASVQDIGAAIRVQNWELAVVPTPPTPPQDYMDVFLWLKKDHNSISSGFSANDYWGGFIQTPADEAALEAFGVPLADVGDGARSIDRTAEQSFTCVPIAIYSSINESDIGANMENYYCKPQFSANPGTAYYGVDIYSIAADVQWMRTWKCRIMRNTGNVVAYLSNNYRVPRTVSNYGMPLYFPDGSAVGYSSTRTYTIIKYYTSGADYTGTPADGLILGAPTGSTQLNVYSTGPVITIQRIEYTVS